MDIKLTKEEFKTLLNALVTAGNTYYNKGLTTKCEKTDELYEKLTTAYGEPDEE